MAPSSLLREYKGSEYDEGFYLFKQSGGGQNRFHITKEDSDESMCGSHSIGALDYRDRFAPKKLEEGESVESLREKSGLGKGICQLCKNQWIYGKQKF